jgi:hypothetical protein
LATVRSFAYNSLTGIPGITGTAQFGFIAAGATSQNYGSGLTWWNGPDEDPGYVICHTSGARTAGQGTINVPSPTIGFWRSVAKTDPSFLSLCNGLFNQNFSTTVAAKTWLTSNGYWTSYINSYTYYRWQITATKTMPPDANCVQAAEFRFTLNGVDQSMSGVTVTNPSGSNPVGETPPNLIDNNLNAKALDLNFVSNGNVTNFIFQFPSSVGFNGYRWATANDAESRDPKSWTVAGSTNGSTWTTLHTVTGFTATSARFTWQTSQVY